MTQLTTRAAEFTTFQRSFPTAPPADPAGWESDGADVTQAESQAAEQADAAPADCPDAWPADRLRLVITLRDGVEAGLVDDELPAALEAGIVDGTFRADMPVRCEVNAGDGNWVKSDATVRAVARNWLSTDALYRPVMSYALAGLRWGAIVGVILKLLDTTVLMAAVDPTMLVLWLLTLGAVFIPRVGVGAVILFSIFSAQAGAPNFFIVAGAATLTGGALGALPGMFVGGLVGIVRRDRAPHSPEAEHEGAGTVLAGVVLPGVAGLAVLAAYVFWLSPLILASLE